MGKRAGKVEKREEMEEKDRKWEKRAEKCKH